MGYFKARYDSRVLIHDCKMFIRLVTDLYYASVANLIKPYNLIVIYNSRVVPDLKIPHITTLDS